MDNSKTRRRFLKIASQSALLAPVASSLIGCSSTKSSNRNEQKNGVGNGMTDRKVSKLEFNVRDFGATGDGKTKDTIAFQQAIDRCSILGGGEVLIPAGEYFTGAIALKSNTILRLDKAATIIGSPDFEDYPISQLRWEGKWIKSHVSLIYAFDADNIGIVGPGKIVGNPALGGRPNTTNPLRHPALIEPVNCNNIRLEDFSTSYHLMWSIHPTFCQSIFIKNLTIRSTGGNGDGIDIDSCKQVHIDSCDMATGDDCISLKSGRGMEGYSLLHTTEDVHITNCTFADSIFACIGIGSETSGGIRNVRIENCRFTKAKTFAIYIKSRPGRGAFIENIICNNLDVSGMSGGFLRFNILNSGLQDQDPVPGNEGIPTIKNFSFSNIRVTDVPVLVEGTAIHPNKPLEGFTLTDVTGTCEKGIFLANIRNAKIRNIHVTGYTSSLINIYNVMGTGLDNAATLQPTKTSDPIPAPQQPYQLH